MKQNPQDKNDHPLSINHHQPQKPTQPLTAAPKITTVGAKNNHPLCHTSRHHHLLTTKKESPPPKQDHHHHERKQNREKTPNEPKRKNEKQLGPEKKRTDTDMNTWCGG
jgi:hypothetical protein